MLAFFGIDVRKTLATLRGLPPYLRNRREFLRLARRDGRPGAFPFGRPHPCLTDRRAQSGVARGARGCFHQDLWVAQRVFENRPRRHVDVGSRVDGFVAHVAAFRPIEVLDIRPLDIAAPNITYRQFDAMAGPGRLEGCTDSLSCLHALEHFGLGRYGDAIDPDGHLKGWDTLHGLLVPGGKLYFSVPIGPQRLEFDAHRIFGVPYLRDLIAPRYRVDAFVYVDDAGELHAPASLDAPEALRSFGCRHGCGVFELTRLA